MSVANLRKIWVEQDATDREEGESAYFRYRKVMLSFSEFYGIPLARTVSAFAALSPNNDYHGNLRSLSSVLDGVKKGHEPDAITVSTYKACRDRAYGYASGNVCFLKTVKGPKIRAFRDNILRPNKSNEVTVDGHMVASWHGLQATMTQASRLLKSRKEYDAIADGITEIASDEGIRPCQAQAVLWFTRKRVLRVKYDAQFNMFQRSDDFWRTLCNPVDFPPFERRAS